MFVTKNQIYVFLACISFGAVAGVLFTLFSPVKSAIKNKWVVAVIDFIIFASISVLYVLFALKMKFPSLMPYMILGVFVGLLAYMKSFHIILA